MPMAVSFRDADPSFESLIFSGSLISGSYFSDLFSLGSLTQCLDLDPSHASVAKRKDFSKRSPSTDLSVITDQY